MNAELLATLSTVLNPLLAQAEAVPAVPEQNLFITLMPLLFFGVIFYFLLIRPQAKRQKEHALLISAVKPGDQIISAGGIHGIITSVKDTSVILKIADSTKVELEKSSITSVTKSSEVGDALPS